MKKSIRSLALPLAVMGCLVANAADFTVDGITYSTIDNTSVGVAKPASGDVYTGAVTIPSTVSYSGTSYTVTALNYESFKGATITSISLPSTLVKLDGYCFLNTASLSSITLPSSVTTIGDGAFNSSGITAITLPASVTTLGKAVFSYAKRLQKIEVAAGSSSFASVDGVLYNSSKTTLVFAPGAKTVVNQIPETCSQIAQYAFNGNNVEEITFPASMRSVGYMAFNLCSNLRSVVMNEGLTKLAGSAFDRCTSLKTVTLPSTMSDIAYDAFSGATGITKVQALGSTPATLADSSFPASVFSSATLEVPAMAYQAYKEAAGWKLFTNIVGVGSQITDEYSATIVEMVNPSKIVLSNPVNLQFKVRNEGKQDINSLTGVLTIDGDAYPAQTISGLNIASGATKEVTLPLTLNEAKYQMSLTITQVNGQANENENATFEFTLETVVVNLPDDCPQATKANFQGTSYYGYRNQTTLGAGTKLVDANLTGLKVIGAKIIGLPNSGIGDVKIWSSTKLLPSPDREKVDVIVDNGEAIAAFADPITLTNAGAFFGVTLNVTDASSWWPFPVSGPDTTTGGFYLNYGSGYSDFSSYGTLQMIFYLEGDIAPDRLAVNRVNGSTSVNLNKSLTVPLVVANYGGQPVTSVTYSYTGDGQDHKVTKEVALDKYLSQAQEISVTLDPIATAGNYTINLTVDKVNGNDNTMAKKSISFPVSVASFEAVHNPILEEYTGTGCGYCPRGTLGMSQMTQRVPSFIGAAYHRYNESDPMYLKLAEPFNVSGAPGCVIDRNGVDADPYYGINDEPMGIQEYYAQQAEIVPPASLSVTCQWDDDIQGFNIDATANFCFVETGRTYKMGFILTVDSLSHPTEEAWEQANYYAGSSSSDPLINSLGNGTFPLDVYNHVVFEMSAAKGKYTISNPTVGQPVTINHKVSGPNSLSDQESFQATGPKNVHAIALLIDDKGRIRNAAKCEATAPGATGITNTLTRNEQAPTVFYDLMGRRVLNPQNGIFVVKQGDKASKIAL